MIRIHGVVDGLEGGAARQLADMLRRAWPWAENDAATAVDLVVGVKCHGQATKDLDVVLLASLPQKARFTPFLSFRRRWDNQWVRPPRVRVESLCVVLELKHNDPADVRFIGGRLEVFYRNDAHPRWHNASEQSHKQIFALKNYLESQGIAAPYITNLVWLPNVQKDQLPPRPHNFLASNMSWELLLNVVGQMSPPEEDGDEWVMRAWPTGCGPERTAVVRLLTLRIEPTRLDRVRMARICEAAVRPEWLDDLGKRQLVLRGRGGTGKTMLLLQLAWRAARDHRARVLLLTYNAALLADIRRLLTLVGDAHGLGADGLQAQSIMSFFASVFRGLGILGEGDDYLDRYESLKKEALALVTQQDAAGLIRERTEAFGWDCIILDEAQDWPEDERDLLRRFYDPKQFVLADGVDQFVRSQRPCDWLAGVPRSDVRVVPLATCLRMKANLARFANQFSTALGLPGWNVEANPDAAGGRIVIIEGDYFAIPELHRRFLAANNADGNQPVDMLLCVPPAFVSRSGGSEPRSSAADRLEAEGHAVWDGVSTAVRNSYPISVAQHRIVQYDSCRGLEGWIVVALGFDEFYLYKLATWQPPEAEPVAFADDPDAAHRFASRWLMIPLSRSVDTLVIQIGPQPSRVREALQTAARECADFVEWLPTAG